MQARRQTTFRSSAARPAHSPRRTCFLQSAVLLGATHALSRYDLHMTDNSVLRPMSPYACLTLVHDRQSEPIRWPIVNLYIVAFSARAPLVHAGQPPDCLHAAAWAYAPLHIFPPIPTHVPAAIPSMAWSTVPTSACGVICILSVCTFSQSV